MPSFRSASALQAANIWRVLRDVNLDAIRASAEARFVLPIIADEVDDARRVQALLSGAEHALHPWVLPFAARDGIQARPEAPLAVLVSRRLQLTPDLAAARDALARDGVAVIMAIVDEDAAPPVIPAAGEAARVIAPALDSRLGRELARAIARTAGPDTRLAFARQFPPVRPTVVTAIIEETAHANASYAFATGLAEVVPILTAPMNLSDMVVLTKNQLVMSYRVALASGLDGDARRLIPEMVGVLGGGFFWRQIARQLVGFIPVLGIVPKVAIAYGGTYAIGRAIAGWAAQGHAVSREALQRFSREGLDRGREIARALRTRPSAAVHARSTPTARHS